MLLAFFPVTVNLNHLSPVVPGVQEPKSISVALAFAEYKSCGAPVFVGKSPHYRSKNKALGIDVDLQGHNALQSVFRFDA